MKNGCDLPARTALSLADLEPLPPQSSEE